MEKTFIKSLSPLFYRKIQNTDFLQFFTGKVEGVYDEIHDLDCPYIKIREYLLTILSGKNGKTYCPFMPAVEKKNGHYAKVYRGIFDENLIIQTMDEMLKMFKHISPYETSEERRPDMIAILAGFTDEKSKLPESFELMQVVHKKERIRIIDAGFMVAYAHPLHPPVDEKQLFTSQIPILVLRRLIREDYIFMRTEEEKSSYHRYFGEARPSPCPFHM